MGGIDGLPGAGGTVEVDETFIGREPGTEVKRAYHHKMKVLSLVDRDTKQVRSVVVDDLKPDTIRPILEENILKEATLHTDTVEGYFSVFKRGMKGVYQHCGKQHLHRYLAEFDFRYNNRVKLAVNDVERAERALSGIVGKRLTYRGSRAETLAM